MSSITEIGKLEMIQTGSIKQPCIYCKAIQDVPVFKHRMPPKFEVTEFIPKAICFHCSEIQTYGHSDYNIDKAYNDSLNKYAAPYICEKNDLELIALHKKIKTLINDKSVFCNQYPFLYIYGVAGSGKTIIAKAISDILHFRFIKAYDLFNFHKSEISSLYFNKLCIDDLGKEVDGHNRTYLTYQLIDNRYDNKASTIITTQLPPNQLSETYGHDFADRIKQYSRFLQMPSKVNWRK